MATVCYAAVEEKCCDCILLSAHQKTFKVCGFMQLVRTFWTLYMTGYFATHPL